LAITRKLLADDDLMLRRKKKKKKRKRKRKRKKKVITNLILPASKTSLGGKKLIRNGKVYSLVYLHEEKQGEV